MHNNTLNLKTIRIAIFLLLLLPAQASFAFQINTINNIPDPKVGSNGYVSNPAGILSDDDVQGINETITKLEAVTNVQVAVVVIHDFDPNQDEFDFALQLFRKWGIGKSKADNGLLLFVAVDRHKYRFITGYGLEGLLPDLALRKIGDEFLVPAFKEGAYGEGIKSAITSIADYLSKKDNKGELDQLMQKSQQVVKPWMQVVISCAIMIAATVLIFRQSKKFVQRNSVKKAKAKANGYDKVVPIGCIATFGILMGIGFTVGFTWVKAIDLSTVPYIVYGFMTLTVIVLYYGVLASIRRFYKDDENFALAVGKFNRASWWYIFASPVTLFAIMREEFRRKKMLRRFAPVADSRQQPMVRINRDENRDAKPYLTAGQLAEENLGVYVYDIWVSTDGVEHKIITNEGGAFKHFDECPRCKLKTYGKPETITLQAATYASEGTGKKVRECKSCHYELMIKMVVLSKLRSSSDSSSSSSGSSSSSSSSDSGGSWGGGSSGGGGAGGSW